jgi:hypothetical protein
MREFDPSLPPHGISWLRAVQTGVTMQKRMRRGKPGSRAEDYARKRAGRASQAVALLLAFRALLQESRSHWAPGVWLQTPSICPTSRSSSARKNGRRKTLAGTGVDPNETENETCILTLIQAGIHSEQFFLLKTSCEENRPCVPQFPPK